MKNECKVSHYLGDNEVFFRIYLQKRALLDIQTSILMEKFS